MSGAPFEGGGAGGTSEEEATDDSGDDGELSDRPTRGEFNQIADQDGETGGSSPIPDRPTRQELSDAIGDDSNNTRNQPDSSPEKTVSSDETPDAPTAEMIDGGGTTETPDVTAAQRQQAAQTLDEQVPERDITEDDVRATSEGFTLAAQTLRGIAATRLDDQVPGQDLTADDVEATSEGFRISDEILEEQGAARLDEIYSGDRQTEGVTVGQGRQAVARAPGGTIERPDLTVTPADVEVVDGEVQPTDALLEEATRQQAAEQLNAQTQVAVTPDRITQTDEGFTLTDETAKLEQRAQIAEETEGASLADVQVEDGEVQFSQRFQRQQAASQIEGASPSDVRVEGGEVVFTDAFREQQRQDQLETAAAEIEEQIAIEDFAARDESGTARLVAQSVDADFGAFSPVEIDADEDLQAVETAEGTQFQLTDDADQRVRTALVAAQTGLEAGEDFTLEESYRDAIFRQTDAEPPDVIELTERGQEKLIAEQDLETGDDSEPVTPHVGMVADEDGIEARREREEQFRQDSKGFVDSLTSGEVPSLTETGGALFATGRQLELGARTVAEGTKDVLPLEGVGPKIGSKTLGAQTENLVAGLIETPAMGVGATVQAPVTIAADAPTLLGGSGYATVDGETPTEAAGGVGDLTVRGTKRLGEMAIEQPLIGAAMIAPVGIRSARSFEGGLAGAGASTPVRPTVQRFSAGEASGVTVGLTRAKGKVRETQSLLTAGKNIEGPTLRELGQRAAESVRTDASARTNLGQPLTTDLGVRGLSQRVAEGVRTDTSTRTGLGQPLSTSIGVRSVGQRAADAVRTEGGKTDLGTPLSTDIGTRGVSQRAIDAVRGDATSKTDLGQPLTTDLGVRGLSQRVAEGVRTDTSTRTDLGQPLSTSIGVRSVGQRAADAVRTEGGRTDLGQSLTTDLGVRGLSQRVAEGVRTDTSTRTDLGRPLSTDLGVRSVSERVLDTPLPTTGTPRLQLERALRDPIEPQVGAAETRAIAKTLRDEGYTQEAAKIESFRGVQRETQQSSLQPREIDPVVGDVLARHELSRAKAEQVTRTMREMDAELYGSVVQEASASRIGEPGVSRTPRDLDVVVKSPERFASRVGERLGDDVAVDGSSVKGPTGEKLFDIHRPEEGRVSGSDLTGQRGDTVAFGVRNEPNVTTAEGVGTTTLSQQTAQKGQGALKQTAATSREVGAVEGLITPEHAGRVKDVPDFYIGEKANIQALRLAGKEQRASRAETALERFTEAFGEQVARRTRKEYREALESGEGVTTQLADFGGRASQRGRSEVASSILQTSSPSQVSARPLSTARSSPVESESPSSPRSSPSQPVTSTISSPVTTSEPSTPSEVSESSPVSTPSSPSAPSALSSFTSQSEVSAPSIASTPSASSDPSEPSSPSTFSSQLSAPSTPSTPSTPSQPSNPSTPSIPPGIPEESRVPPAALGDSDSDEDDELPLFGGARKGIFTDFRNPLTAGVIETERDDVSAELDEPVVLGFEETDS